MPNTGSCVLINRMPVVLRQDWGAGVTCKLVSTVTLG